MAFRVRTIAPDDPPDTFPDPAAAGLALGYPDGLLAIGGDLGTERLLTAYRREFSPGTTTISRYSGGRPSRAR